MCVYILGYKVIFRGAIDGKPCERNFYQPFKFNSSGNSGCVYNKSVCTEEGQFIYKNENSQTDRVCRCDDSKGYAFIHRPQHRCYCVPSKEDCSCYFKKCSPGELLSKGILVHATLFIDFTFFSQMDWNHYFFT